MPMMQQLEASAFILCLKILSWQYKPQDQMLGKAVIILCFIMQALS